jgi:hypothetical protein
MPDTINTDVHDKRINVDFDATLTEGNVRYWAGEEPTKDDDVVDRIINLYRSGATIIVWTARPWREANSIASHLVEWEVPYHGLRCNKGSGDVYIDDKAVRPEEAVDGDALEKVLDDV